MKSQAFISRRVVTSEGIQPGAILVEGEQIQGVVPLGQVPAGHEVHDFGDSAILPGLVDSHVHINEPGRTEWEGFQSATRAAAAGGYTLLVDMPLNCLPATTTVAALEAKRAAAQDKCRVDWAAWGWRGPQQSGRHRSPRGCRRAGVQVFSNPSGRRRFHHGCRGGSASSPPSCCADRSAIAGTRGARWSSRRGHTAARPCRLEELRHVLAISA